MKRPKKKNFDHSCEFDCKGCIGTGYNLAIDDYEKFLLSENRIFRIILKCKYPTGLPLLPNATGGAILQDVYPEEFKVAKAISKRLGNHPDQYARMKEQNKMWRDKVRRGLD